MSATDPTPAEPDAGAVEALARVLWKKDRDDSHWSNDWPATWEQATTGRGPNITGAHWMSVARTVLVSDWLAAHDAEVSRATAERIARAIEAWGGGRPSAASWQHTAARIARGDGAP